MPAPPPQPPEDQAPAPPRNIVACAFDGVNLLNLAGPLHCFATLERLPETRGRRLYRNRVVSAHGGLVETSAGLSIATEPFAALDDEAIDTLLIPGGRPLVRPEAHPELLDWVRHRAPAARRVCAIGAGMIALAATGLLDGRRAVSHWSSLELMARRYPKVRLQSDALFLHDGSYWTTAGGAAGIDLALRLITDDLGQRLGLAVARFLALYAKRSGEEPQLSSALALQGTGGRFERLAEWIAANLDRPLSLTLLADQAGMSVRNFSRAYAAATGASPMKTVEAMRLELAARLLADPEMRVPEIARRAGFGDDERMRRAFLRRFGLSPLEYRQRSDSPDTGPAI